MCGMQLTPLKSIFSGIQHSYRINGFRYHCKRRNHIFITDKCGAVWKQILANYVECKRFSTLGTNYEHLLPQDLESDGALSKYDSLILLSSRNNFSPTCLPLIKKYFELVKKRSEVDNNVEKEVCFIPVDQNGSSIKCLVHSPCGALKNDYDDVRCFYEAACNSIKRVLKSGAKKPLLVLPAEEKAFQNFDLASLLGALEGLYVPLEVREALPEKARKIEMLGISNYDGTLNRHVLNLSLAIESGRILCRDIGGSDPERMCPPAVADYVKAAFADSCIKVSIIDDEQQIQKEYPLLAAVDRATRGIDRHRARVVYLTYEPEDGIYDTTVALVGKGVTYDTGGADIKAGGMMVKMHRDKCGSAAVAGFFQVLAVLKPKGIKVIGGMAMCRNSVGPEGYVSDEIITSRAGKRIRIGNTDAEGRLAMTDVLCYLKEQVVNEKNPHLFTIATLTGHARRTAGSGYSIIMENGPAKAENVGMNIAIAGESVGDMFEVSTLRREDYERHKGKSEYEDLVQHVRSAPHRGHQGPGAFMIMACGLDEHGLTSSNPLKYCHIDIAGSSGPFPGIPSGAPIPALTKHFILPR